jgi:Asp-tRNA(Asn)/Glu-tRNA(Gln) amidotransferase A subunit family amidase
MLHLSHSTFTDTLLPIGKTCTTEFAATVVGPKSRNPHDATRTPGGSSSGSGAAVGDMQVPIGLGTQTVGSTIRPGSFNGIYAMKPTWNSISREGQKLYSLIFDTLGLYSRSVEDLQLLADVFKLEDDEPGEHFAVKGAKFAVLKFKTPNWSEAGQGTKDALDLGVKLLKDQGAEVEELVLPNEFDHLTLWHKQVLTGDGRVAFLSDYYTTKEHLHESLVGHVENSDGYSRKEQLVAFDGLAALRPKMDEILGKYAAIIAPSALDEAPVGTNTGNATFCGIWTVSSYSFSLDRSLTIG